MSNVCLACGALRDDPRDSFACPTCQLGMDLPPGWDDIAYWLIYLRDDLVYTVREITVHDGKLGQVTHQAEADSLEDARAQLPGNVKAVHTQPGWAMPDTLVEVWAPIRPEASVDGAGP